MELLQYLSWSRKYCSIYRIQEKHESQLTATTGPHKLATANALWLSASKESSIKSQKCHWGKLNKYPYKVNLHRAHTKWQRELYHITQLKDMTRPQDNQTFSQKPSNRLKESLAWCDNQLKEANIRTSFFLPFFSIDQNEVITFRNSSLPTIQIHFISCIIFVTRLIQLLNKISLLN